MLSEFLIPKFGQNSHKIKFKVRVELVEKVKTQKLKKIIFSCFRQMSLIFSLLKLKKFERANIR